MQLHLVAPVFGEIDLPPHDDYLADFVFDQTTLKNLITQVEKIYVYGSKDDPLVPFSHIQKYKEYLPQAKFHIFEDRGHFFQPEFPELLENIMK
jgi:pimeloyl-ACP methyl ester carboxylesterase